MPQLRTVRIACALASSAALAAAGASAAPPPTGWDFRLDAREEYRVRSGSGPDESDQRMHLLLELGGADPSRRTEASGTLALWWTTAGKPPAAEPYGLATLYGRRNPWADVLGLHVERRELGAVRVARAGRQETPHGRPGTFDGVYALARPWGAPLDLFAFGGRTVHFFETEPGLLESWLASVGATYRPSPALKLETDVRVMRDVLHHRDDPGARDATATSYGLSAWWRRGEQLAFKGTVRGVNAAVERIEGLASASAARVPAGVEARIGWQPSTLGELDLLGEPYFLTLGPSLPHLRWRVDGWASLSRGGGEYSAHAGFEGRRNLRDEETAFNRNVDRLYALAAARDVGIRGLRASLSLDRDSTGALLSGPGGAWSVNGSAGYERGRFDLEVGTQYYVYRYDYFADLRETADVRVFHGTLRLGVAHGLSAQVRAAHEVFDRRITTVVVALSQSY